MPVAHYGELNPLSANPTKWSNALKQFVGNSHFAGLALKGLSFIFSANHLQKSVRGLFTEILETYMYYDFVC